jgi:hypothetical protein
MPRRPPHRGRTFTAEESWSKMLRYAGLWALLGFGLLGDRGEGLAGRRRGRVRGFQAEIEPSFGGAPEIGRWRPGRREGFCDRGRSARR